MDFRHLIVTCLFSMLRLSFEAQKIKENYAIFFSQCPSFISKPLCAKGKEVSDKGPRSANRTAKITTFIIMIQIKRKLFLLFCKAGPTPLQHVKIKCCPSLGKRMQK